MRSAEQIGRTVSEYHEWQRAQRAKHLREALAMLHRAREEGAEWYVWIASGGHKKARPPPSPAA